MAHEPTRDERRAYPLLTQRAEWPPQDRGPDFSPAEREEMERYVVARREAAERAAEQSFRDNKVPAWFAERFPDKPEPAPGTDEIPWYLRPPSEGDERAAPESDKDWQHRSRDDFRVDEFYVEFRARQEAYDRDLWTRAVNLPRTREENELMKRAEQSSPEMRKAMEDHLFDRRVQRLRTQDDARRLEDFEARLGPSLQEPYDDYARTEGRYDERDPVPGPYHRLEHPSDLQKAQDEMLHEYHRDPDEERER